MKIINNTANAMNFVVTQSGSATLSGAEGQGNVVYSGGLDPDSAVSFDPKNTGEGPVVYVTAAETGNRGHFRRKVASKDSTVSLTFTEE